MPEEHDSWFKAAFGVDLAEAAGKIKDEALETIDNVKSAVAKSAAAGAAAVAGAGSFPLGGSVGKGGKNAASDVRAVQRALGITADGDCGPQTVDAIKAYQRKVGMSKPDGRVDPGGMTERALAGGSQPPVAASNDERVYGSRPKLAEAAMKGDPYWRDRPSSSTAVKGDLLDALLQQQTALLQSLANAGSDAEKEQIQEELEGVGAEISDELQALKAKEPGRDTGSSDGSVATKGPGSASDTGSNATAGAGPLMLGVGQGVKDFAAETYAGMKENAKLVADGEHWVAGQIDDLQDTAAAEVQGVADMADGIPVVEQAADFGAAAFDQATQLTAGTWEGAVGLGGGILQMAANPVDAATGLYTMAEHVPNPVAGFPNPLKAAHELVNVATSEETLGDTTAKLFDPVEQQKDDAEYWKKVGGGIADQYGKTVGEDGDYAKGVGRGLFDIGSNFFGVGEAKVAGTAKMADASELARAPTILDDATKLPEGRTVPEAAQMPELGIPGKAAEAPAMTEASRLLESVLDETAKAFKTRDLSEKMLDDASRRAKALDAAEASKPAEARTIVEPEKPGVALVPSETTKPIETMLDEAAKAVGASQVVEGVKQAVARTIAPKAGSITAQNIARVPGVKQLLERLERLKLPFDLDELIAMVNRDPAAAITELNRRLEIIETYAEDAMRGGGARTMEELEELSEVKSPGGRKPSDKTVAGNFYHQWAEIFEELLTSRKARFEDVVPEGSLRSGLEPEFPVPHPDYPPGAKPRIDRLDRAGGEVIEIGPNTQAAQKQAEAMQYAEWMDRFEPLPNGRKWRPRAVLYDQERVLAFLKKIGYIE